LTIGSRTACWFSHQHPSAATATYFGTFHSRPTESAKGYLPSSVSATDLFVVTIIIVIFFSCGSFLCRLLLLLVLTLASSVLGKWLLQDLKNLFICDLLVCLVLRCIWRRWRSQSRKTILCDNFIYLAPKFRTDTTELLTNGTQESGYGLAIFVAYNLILTKCITTHAFNHTYLSFSLILKLP